MPPLTADLAGPEGRAIPYRWATPGQHAQAVLWLAQQLQHHFLPPAMEVWSEVLALVKSLVQRLNERAGRGLPLEGKKGLYIKAERVF